MVTFSSITTHSTTLRQANFKKFSPIYFHFFNLLHQVAEETNTFPFFIKIFKKILITENDVKKRGDLKIKSLLPMSTSPFLPLNASHRKGKEGKGVGCVLLRLG